MDAQLLRDTLADLDHDLLERDVPVRLLLLAALAGEHVLLIGPPGTAKSELARRLQRSFTDTRYFERLLTRFSVPEELFGPLSLKALEQDRYERLVEGFLPSAHIAFLDEVFKANSAILNALLTLLNEREFDNGSGRIRVPLLSVVGASNEVPDDEALHAFYDRFLLRVPVAPVNDASFRALLALPMEASIGTARISQLMLAGLRMSSQGVTLGEPVAGLLTQARAWCASHHCAVSDRRWRKLVGLLKVQAASRHVHAVAAWDLWLLPFVLAQQTAQTGELVQWFMQTVAHAAPVDVSWLTRAAEAFEKQLEIESRAQATHDEGAGKVALARAISAPGSGAADGMVRIVAQGAQRRYCQLHVDTRVAQVFEVLRRAQTALDAALASALEALGEARGHAWLPPSWLARIDAVHRANGQTTAALVTRLQQLRQGFAALPVDQRAVNIAPAPVALAA